MPAAVKIAADAMGVEVKALMKMMEEGKLDPNELLPKMAKEMDKLTRKNDAYNKSLATSRVAQGRMKFWFEDFVSTFTKGGGESGYARIFNSIADFFKEGTSLATTMGKAWDRLSQIVRGLIGGLEVLGRGFVILAEKLGLSTEALAMLAGAALVAAAPFGVILLSITALLMVLDDLDRWAKGKDSFFKDIFAPLGIDIEEFKTLALSLVTIAGAAKLFAAGGGFAAAGKALATSASSGLVAAFATNGAVAVAGLSFAGAVGVAIGTALNSYMADNAEWQGFWGGLFERIDWLIAKFDPDSDAAKRILASANADRPTGAPVITNLESSSLWAAPMSWMAELAGKISGNYALNPEDFPKAQIPQHIIDKSNGLTGEQLRARMSEMAAQNSASNKPAQFNFGDVTFTFTGTDPASMTESVGNQIFDLFKRQLDEAAKEYTGT